MVSEQLELFPDERREEPHPYPWMRDRMLREATKPGARTGRPRRPRPLAKAEPK